MALEQVEISEIVQRAVQKSLDVPEFQRDFVWDPEQVKLLAESLYRGYPVGSFLLWDSSAYREAKTADGAQSSLWIVDGQQRTTALCLLFGQKPYWWPDAKDWNEALQRYDVMFNLLPDADGEQFDFALPNPIRRRDPRWMSVRRILACPKSEDLTKLAQEQVDALTADYALARQLFTVVHGRMQRLWQVQKQEIPIIKTTHEVEDVAEIFSRLNQAGTRVKEADVILALAAVRNPGWVRQKYLPFRSDLEERGWDLDAGIFIRTMTSIGYGRARLAEVPTSFWSQGNLPSVWSQTSQVIGGVIHRLAQFGILSSSLLPSANALIPLFTLHASWSETPDYRMGAALRWFLLASRDGRYSGSAITSLNEDVRAIKEARSFPEALEALLKHLRVDSKVEATEFLNRYDRKGNYFLRLLMYMVLFNRSATDWVDRTRLGYDQTGSAVVSGYEPQWHHIYPCSLLRNSGISGDDTHALANITVLNERTNVSKLSGKPPWRYIEQFKLSREQLDQHLIPASFADNSAGPGALQQSWGGSDLKDRYAEFVLARAELLAQEATAFLSAM